MINRVAINMSMPADLKKELHKIPRPRNVSWSEIWQVMMMAAVAERKGLSDAQFQKQLAAHPKGDVIRDWIRKVYRDYLY